MGAMFQQNLPAMPVERVAGEGEPPVQKMDDALTLDEAKQLFGASMWRAIRDTDHGLKDYGDPAQVGRYCKGIDVPPVIARLLQDPDSRREFVLALASKCRAGLTVQVLITAPARGRLR